VYSSSWNLRATERHLPYGITQCYLPPDTGERAPPYNPSHAGRYSAYLPRRDGRLSLPCYSETQPPGVELGTSRSRFAVYLSYSMLYDKSTTDRKPTASLQQKSTTSCTTISKSHNKLDNLSHNKSTTKVHSKLHATISKSYSKSHNLLYNQSTANRSNGVRHLYVVRKLRPVLVITSSDIKCQTPLDERTNERTNEQTNMLYNML